MNERVIGDNFTHDRPNPHGLPFHDVRGDRDFLDAELRGLGIIEREITPGTKRPPETSEQTIERLRSEGVGIGPMNPTLLNNTIEEAMPAES